MKTNIISFYFNMIIAVLFCSSISFGLTGCGDDNFTPKTKPDYDPNDKGTVTIEDKPSTIEMEGTGGTTTLTFKATFPWTASVVVTTEDDEEVTCSWARVDVANGDEGDENAIAITIDQNESIYDTRSAKVVILSGTGSAISITLNQNYLIKTMNAADIADYAKYYTPNSYNEGFKGGPEGMLKSDARYSWWRHKQSEHFVVFWEAGFRDDPNAETVPVALRVNIDDLLEKAELFYSTNIETLKFAEVGQDKSYLDKYKMQIYLLYQTEWLATGSGYDNVIGALWVNPSTCKPVGSTIAHEIGHSFQYQVYCDKLLNGATDNSQQGFRYGFAADASGGNSFWEQCAQWQSFQNYPTELFGSHVSVFKANSHRHFNHEWMRYASYWLQYYWAQKHQISVVGNIWNQSYFPEDPVTTYRRLYCSDDLNLLYAELYDYATRMVTFDIDVVRNYRTQSAQTNHTTKMYESTNGYYQVGYASCPGTTGFNIIPLNLPEGDNTIRVTFEGLTPGSSLSDIDPGNQVDGDGKTVANVSNYNTNSNTDSGWRYGFVAVVNETAQYSPMYSANSTTVSYTVPVGTTYFYMVVMGAPNTYENHPWNDNESDDAQWPYKVKFDGTDLLGSFLVDETANPQDVTLTYDLDCDASYSDYTLGTINLALSQRLAQAFALKSATLESKLMSVGQQPEEGKIAIALALTNGTYSYSGNANNGFWCTAEGNVGGWGSGGVFFEFSGLSITYGHRPGMSITPGESAVMKPTLIYTKNGVQYKATIVLNMQF